jgi:hypothetical protein
MAPPHYSLTLNKHLDATNVFPELILGNMTVRTVLIELIRHGHPLTILVALVEELDVVFLSVLIDTVFVSAYGVNSIHLSLSLVCVYYNIILPICQPK